MSLLTGLSFHLLSQVLVTCALLLLAYQLRSSNPDTLNLIIGAVITHWLHEASASGRIIASGQNGHTTIDVARQPSATRVDVSTIPPPAHQPGVVQ